MKHIGDLPQQLQNGFLLSTDILDSVWSISDKICFCLHLFHCDSFIHSYLLSMVDRVYSFQSTGLSVPASCRYNSSNLFLVHSLHAGKQNLQGNLYRSGEGCASLSHRPESWNGVVCLWNHWVSVWTNSDMCWKYTLQLHSLSSKESWLIMLNNSNGEHRPPVWRVSNESILTSETRTSETNWVMWLKPAHESERVHLGVSTPIIENPVKLNAELRSDFNDSKRRLYFDRPKMSEDYTPAFLDLQTMKSRLNEACNTSFRSMP